MNMTKTLTLEQIHAQRAALDKQAAALELPILEGAMTKIATLAEQAAELADARDAASPGMGKQAIDNVMSILGSSASNLQWRIDELKGLLG